MTPPVSELEEKRLEAKRDVSLLSLLEKQTKRALKALSCLPPLDTFSLLCYNLSP
jgi:hypothetical protein